jgi:hypothetical protein
LVFGKQRSLLAAIDELLRQAAPDWLLGWFPVDQIPVIAVQSSSLATEGLTPKTGFVTLSEIGPIWTINQRAKYLKFLASTLAVVGKFRSV